ncbi:MAG: OmpA family protein [Pseudomonadota bacterium]
MKEKPSEWVAISDLMAGVMAVVMLLLVVAVLQKGVSELRYQEELAKAKGTKDEAVAKVTQVVSEMIGKRGAAGLMSFDAHTNRLVLRDGVFERGSACLKFEVKAEVATVQADIARFLADNPTARILVEGYTDNVQVRDVVKDRERFCAVYDDNYTLSAARAREARRALIGTLDKAVARRVVVAGYGDSRLLPGIDPADARNRRVEVQFLIETDESQAERPLKVAANAGRD